MRIEGVGLESLERILVQYSLFRFIAPLKFGACLDLAVIGTEARSEMTNGRRKREISLIFSH